MWTWESYRCEHWHGEPRSWLVLFRGTDEALRRPVRDPREAEDAALSWLRSISGDSSAGLAEPSRRRIDDRRKDDRGGRRDGERHQPDEHDA